MLAIGGRRAFWPRKQVVAFDPERAVIEGAGWWRRFGDRVLRRPGLALAASLLVFAVGALGLIAYKEDYSTTTFFKKPTESVDGFKVLERALPAGSLAPTNVLVVSEGGPVSPIGGRGRAATRGVATGSGRRDARAGRARAIARSRGSTSSSRTTRTTRGR